MDKPIGVGDLVMVVKPNLCCGSTARVGNIFRVTKITRGRNYCCQCHAIHENVEIAHTGAINNGVPHRYRRTGYQVERLKRIDPLSEPETIERKQEQPA